MVSLGYENVATKLRDLMAEAGVILDLHCVSGSKIPETLQQALVSDADAVLIGGGDGTVAGAAGVFAGSEKPLGILPLGTFNLAARDIGMPLDLEAAVRALLESPAGWMDMMDIGGNPALCVLVLGFYPALKMGKPEYHGNWLIKAIRTAGLALRSAATFPPLDLILRKNGQSTRHRSRIALLTNNDYEDLFGFLPVRRSLDAGFFTLYVSNHRTRFGMFKSFLSWTLGRWKQDRELTVLQATEIEIQVPGRRKLAVMRDGEIENLPLPLRVTLLPRALRVIAPRLGAAQQGEAEREAVAGTVKNPDTKAVSPIAI